MPHPDEGLLHAWLDGELDAADAKRVEELVANDPAWAAAAAEARGLLAATSRIVRALDHMSPSVVPKARPPLRAPRWWMVRVAALAVIVAGTAIVMRRSEPGLALRESAGAPVANESLMHAQAPAAKATPSPAPVAVAPEKKTTLQHETGKEALAALARSQPAVLEDRTDAAAKVRIAAMESLRLSPAGVAGATAAPERRNADARGAVSAMKAASRDQATTLPASPRAKMEKDSVRPSSASLCFQVRQPASNEPLLLRFDTTQLADSVRLRKVTRRGDTLWLDAGQRLAIKVPCLDP